MISIIMMMRNINNPPPIPTTRPIMTAWSSSSCFLLSDVVVVGVVEVGVVVGVVVVVVVVVVVGGGGRGVGVLVDLLGAVVREVRVGIVVGTEGGTASDVVAFDASDAADVRDGDAAVVDESFEMTTGVDDTVITGVRDVAGVVGPAVSHVSTHKQKSLSGLEIIQYQCMAG